MTNGMGRTNVTDDCYLTRLAKVEKLEMREQFCCR